MIDLGRIPFLGVIWRGQTGKNLIKAVCDEASRNLERYQVFEQRQFITDVFEIEACELAKISCGIDFTEEILSYASTVQDFNASLKDVKDFEEFYISDLVHKTRENAEMLHFKKEFLEEKLKRMRPIIVSAQKCLNDLLNEE